jgi:hypothetical protein
VPFANAEDERPLIDHVLMGHVGDAYAALLSFLNRLDRAGMPYRLLHVRPESILVDVASPGWRWEIEFMADGTLEIERFQSVDGVSTDPALVESLFSDL